MNVSNESISCFQSKNVSSLLITQVNALDLAPNYAGSLTAMINGTSTISGIITPYLIGLLTPDVSILTRKKNGFSLDLLKWPGYYCFLSGSYSFLTQREISKADVIDG